MNGLSVLDAMRYALFVSEKPNTDIDEMKAAIAIVAVLIAGSDEAVSMSALGESMGKAREFARGLRRG